MSDARSDFEQQSRELIGRNRLEELARQRMEILSDTELGDATILAQAIIDEVDKRFPQPTRPDPWGRYTGLEK
jgi:hypothetical protein